MKNKIVVVLLIAVAFFGFAALSNTNTHQCVDLYIDYGSLNNGEKVIGCIDINPHTNAVDVLSHANIKITGTEKYPTQIVCRVNGFPTAASESCKTMPPEKAYWAVIVKQHSNGIMASKWGWAQTGINDVYLNPGESLGLVFTENGELKWPN